MMGSGTVQLSVREAGDIRIIDIDGKIDMEEERKFRDLVTDLLDANLLKLVFNFTKCGYLCSPALGIIAVSIKKSREGNGDVKLLKVNEYLHSIFEITKLTQIVDFYDDEATALGSFEKA